MADGIQVPRCEPSSRPLSGMKLSPRPPPSSSSRKVLRYEQRQAYVAHTDYFNYKTSADHNWDPRAGGTNRMATLFLCCVVFVKFAFPPESERERRSTVFVKMKANEASKERKTSSSAGAGAGV